jgi:hypothetical protein
MHSPGGVKITALEGRIVVNNTLERYASCRCQASFFLYPSPHSRLSLALQGLQPVVRHILFPSSRAEIREKPEPTGLYVNSDEEDHKQAEEDLLGHSTANTGNAEDVPDLL